MRSRAFLVLSLIRSAVASKIGHSEIFDVSQKISKAAGDPVAQIDAQEFRTPNREYSVKFDNHFNVQYSGSFTIGEQELQMIYDTGSFEVLVLSTLCRSCRRSLEMFDSKHSPSYRSAESIIAEHEFISGKVVTVEGFDTLHLGKKNSPVSSTNMTIWQVTKHELSFWKTGNAIFSGIVGLSHVKKIPEGFSGDEGQPKSMLEEMHLDAFALCYQRGGSGDGPGWLKFGPSISAMSKDAGFQSVDVSGDSHWATKLSQFKVDIDGIDTSSMCRPSCGALIDSGTSLLTFPRSASHITEALKRKVKTDCSNLNELPTLYFELDGAEVVLPPRAYIFKVKTASGGYACKGAFMKVDRESQFGEVFILGMPFLRYYYTVFDRQNKQVHIARSTEDCQVARSMALLAHGSNQSELAGKSGLGLTEADFKEPTKADLDLAIAPSWLHAPGGKIHF